MTHLHHRVIVCGGRNYNNSGRVGYVLKALCGDLDGDVTIVHGASRGADLIAEAEAIKLGFDVESHPANWRELGAYAGPKRNQEMIDAGAEFVIAFPGGRGTEDCVRRAVIAGIPVVRGDDA